MDPFSFIDKWFWAVCIAGSFVNVAIMKSRARPYIQANPQLEDGYRNIIKGMLIWSDLPFVVLGIGSLAGRVPSVFSIFRPRDGNPYIIAFYASVILTWILGTNWIIFRGDAEMLVKHPGVFNFTVRSPRTVILLWLLGIACGIAGLIFAYYYTTPITPR